MIFTAEYLARQSRNQMEKVFTTKWFMILRTPTENENASPTNPMDVMLSEAKHLLFR